jgi:2-C-methyl-D-erythritol 2,4-cyclodiphosphate synthase/2-C-methyl-D-erythritol 4-phosphate cytidylyltransferase/2-C-methyl-D-erythritol 2,4-cyclodiphosphate synthase
VVRIGLGYDIHRLIKGRKFLLGGLEIPFLKGEDGHSDGDVLAHAVCDALLGACALGDIGELFPPSDPMYKDADSMKLLKDVYSRINLAGWKIINLDCVIICEKPKILPYRDVIRKSLAETLEIQVESVFLKGKTAEGQGSVGRGKAIEAHVVCLIESIGF